MECPICYNLINNSAMGSCCHHFCYECLIKWCRMSKSNCPVCKEKIYEIKLDKEFDNINNPKCLLNDFINFKQNIIKIDFSNNNILPGITLKNNNPGVKIIKLVKNGRFALSGFELGDIIISINNVPTINHIDSIKIIDKNFDSEKIISVELLNIKKITIKT